MKEANTDNRREDDLVCLLVDVFPLKIREGSQHPSQVNQVKPLFELLSLEPIIDFELAVRRDPGLRWRKQIYSLNERRRISIGNFYGPLSSLRGRLSHGACSVIPDTTSSPYVEIFLGSFWQGTAEQVVLLLVIEDHTQDV